MTVRGTFDPTGFVPGDPDTFPPTDERDPLTYEGEPLTYDGEPLFLDEVPVYYDGDRWDVVADGTFQGLDLTAGGVLTARIVPSPALEFDGSPIVLDGSPLLLTT